MTQGTQLKRDADLADEAGQMLAENFAEQGHNRLLEEKFGIEFSEAGQTGQTTTTASGSYANLLGSTLYNAAIDRMEPILDLVDVNEDMVDAKGFGAYQIPRMTPTQAFEVAEGEVVNYFEEGTDSIVVTPTKKVVGTSLTWEIMNRGMDGFAQYVMQNAAEALERKLTSDIVNGLAAGAGFTESGGIGMDKIRTAETNVKEATHSNGVNYGFLPDKFVVTPAAHSTIQGTTEYQEAVWPSNARGGNDTNLQHVPLEFHNMEIVETPYLDSAQALVLESGRNVLVKESDLETYEGSISGRPYDQEVVALMSYVLAIIYPKSVCEITS